MTYASGQVHIPSSEMNKKSSNRVVLPDGREVVRAGRFPRVVRLRSEYFEHAGDPQTLVDACSQARVKADVLSFVDGLSPERRREYPFTIDSKAVLRINTYEDWWKRTINDKTRNMVRKAGKKGVEIRFTTFDEKLVSGIHEIYNESPIRQGRIFPHYGMSREQVREANRKFADQCDFIGAYIADELIGFSKIVHTGPYSALMQIISMVKHRDKAPTNALLAKAVEICAERKIPLLMYGMWSRRTLGDFKLHHGFERMDVPRYFVPLTSRGRLALKLRLHEPMGEKLVDSLPEPWIRSLADLRMKWHLFRHRKPAI
jgi:hypothetical protein